MIETAFLRHYSTGHGDNGAAMSLDNARQSIGLKLAIALLPIKRDDLAKRHACIFFNLAIQLNKWRVKYLCDPCAQG